MPEKVYLLGESHLDLFKISRYVTALETFKPDIISVEEIDKGQLTLRLFDWILFLPYCLEPNIDYAVSLINPFNKSIERYCSKLGSRHLSLILNREI